MFKNSAKMSEKLSLGMNSDKLKQQIQRHIRTGYANGAVAVNKLESLQQHLQAVLKKVKQITLFL